MPRRPSSLPDTADATFDLTITAIDFCRALAPQWLADRDERERRAFAMARAEIEGRSSPSPRAAAAARALACIRHHDWLGTQRAELQAAAARFATDREAAAADVSRRRTALEAAVSANDTAREKHEQLKARAAALSEKLRQPCAAAEASLQDAQRELDRAIATEDEAAMAKAAELLSEGRKRHAAAAAAATSGAEAEVLAAQLGRIAAASTAADAAAAELEAAQEAVRKADEHAFQIEIDSALATAADRLASGAFRAGQVGRIECDATLTAPRADSRRVPLLDDGLRVLLSMLYPPDYSRLEVDLSALPGAGPSASVAPFYDEALTRAANRTAPQFYPPEALSPQSERVSVRYSDPELDAAANRVRRVEG